VSDGFGYSESGVTYVISQWEDLSELMATTKSDLTRLDARFGPAR